MPTTEPNPRQSSTRNTTPPAIVVEKLTTVARNRSGEALYLGWGPEGNAAATRDRRALSAESLDVLTVYDRARNLHVPVVPYADLEPVEYAYFKLKDLDSPAEDYFVVNVKDAAGAGAQYRVGELALLEGIVNAKDFFQDTSTGGVMGQRVVPSEPLYAVIAPCFEFGDKPLALAILFKPPLSEMPQAGTFKDFLVSVLRVLWQNDRKDATVRRKGYFDLVQPHLSAGQGRAPLWLRLLFVDEENARRKWDQIRRLLFKTAESGATRSTADDLDQMDMERLFALATAMRDAARAYLDRNSPAKRPFRFDRR